MYIFILQTQSLQLNARLYKPHSHSNINVKSKDSFEDLIDESKPLFAKKNIFMKTNCHLNLKKEILDEERYNVISFLYLNNIMYT